MPLSFPAPRNPRVKAGISAILRGMAKSKSKSSGGHNDDRPNGKAWKKIKKVSKKTGKTIDGYSPSRIAIRISKRSEK